MATTMPHSAHHPHSSPLRAVCERQSTWYALTQVFEIRADKFFAVLIYRSASVRCSTLVVVYNVERKVTSVLLEISDEDWEVIIFPRLQAIADAMCVPTAVSLILLQQSFSEERETYGDIFTTVARVRMALNMEPFSYERTPTRLEDYSDLSKATLELTQLAERAALLKNALQVSQDSMSGIWAVHDAFWKTVKDPSTDMTVLCNEIKSRLQYLSTEIRELQGMLEMQSTAVQTLIQTVRKRYLTFEDTT